MREKIAKKYESGLMEIGISFPKVNQNALHSRHLFPIFVGKNNRDIILSKLSENQIGATVNYRSITTMNFYKKKYSFQSSRFINSENWGEGTLSIPLFESLKTDEIQYVIDTLVHEVTPMIGSKHNV